jgi:hypothetical protein
MAVKGRSLASYAPNANDEVGYYLQIQSFVHKGWAGGYFTICEQPAPARFSPFGVHGPLFPVLYGLVGKVFGWRLYSGPLFNCGFFMLAVAVFCVVHRPTTFQALLGTALLVTYWPLYLYLISNSQDPVHLAAAVMFGAYFAALLAGRQLTGLASAGFWLLLVYASLMRISWTMMIFPYLVLRRPIASRKDLFLRIVIGVLIAAVLLCLFRWLCAPYPGSRSSFLMNKIISLDPETLSYFATHTWYNLKSFVTAWRTFGLFMPGTIVFYQAVAFGTVMALLGAARALPWLGRWFSSVPLREAALHSYNIWALAAAMITLYYVDQNGGWRMYSIHFLLSALMVIVSRTRGLYLLAVAAIAVNLWYSGRCLEDIEGFNASRVGVHKARDFAKAIDGLIVYEEGANPWRNTVLADRYPASFAGLPPGIGVSICHSDDEFPRAPKSKYLLLDVDHTALLSKSAKPVRVFHLMGGRFEEFAPPSAAVLIINDPRSLPNSRP